ncbi:hypothetical protein [Paenibacillus sp. IHBB 3054]|uniref:hypothetical protein n=1 Tax=Paenibacillus sp. IHBB 3054 TaxID=3425689 RepID=UPI003F679624
MSKHKAKLQENVHALFADIEAAEHQEERECQGKDLAELGESCEMSSEKLEHLTQTAENEQYQTLLGDRNSFSKTDPDATFIRMKEDHMRKVNRLGTSCEVRKATPFPYDE